MEDGLKARRMGSKLCLNSGLGDHKLASDDVLEKKGIGLVGVQQNQS
jgi:hypothetical protein